MTGDYRALASVALEIADRRAGMLDAMRMALLRGDEKEALQLLRVYLGLEEESDAPQSDRTRARQH